MADLLSYIEKQPLKPTDIRQQHFTHEILDHLEKERLLVLFSQDFTPIDAYRGALETTLKNKFGESFYTIGIPSYVDDQEEYFQEIAECCGLKESVTKLHHWKKAMERRLRSKLQPVMLLITDFEDGNEEYDTQFAKALRSLKIRFAHLYVLFIGRKALANLVYKDGGLSPLYNVEQRFFPEHGLKLGREKIVTQFHSLNGKYRTYLCELLEEEDLGDFTPWSSNVTINELFWRNLLVKHEERMIWRGKLTCQIGREVLKCDHP